MATRRKIGSIFVDMVLGNAQFDKDVNKFQRKLKRFGRDMERTGKSLTKGFTLPVAAIGVAAVKTATNFETAFAGVRKTVNATEAQFKQLEKGIIKLSLTIPKSTEELSKFAEIGGTLNIQPENLLKFTETIARLSDSLDGISPEDAARKLGQFANITGMAQSDIDRLGSAITELGNNLATNEGPIVEMSQRIAGIGTVAGMSEAEIVGIAGAMAALGEEAEAGGTAMQKTIKALLTASETGKKLEEFAGVLQMTGQEFKDAFKADSTEVLIQFVERLKAIKEEGGSVVGTLNSLGLKTERLQTALLKAVASQDGLRNAVQLSKEAWAANIALLEESNKKYQTFGAQIQILWNSLKAFLKIIGDDLMPFLKTMTAWLLKATKALMEMNPETRRAGLAFAAVVAAIGPLVTIGGIFIATVASPMLLWAGAITVALGGVAAAWVKWGDDISAIVSLLAKDFMDTLNAVKEEPGLIAEMFVEMGKDIVEAVKKMVLGVKDWMVNKFDSLVVQPVRKALRKLQASLKACGTRLQETLTCQIWSKISFSSLADLTEGWFSQQILQPTK